VIGGLVTVLTVTAWRFLQGIAPGNAGS